MPWLPLLLPTTTTTTTHHAPRTHHHHAPHTTHQPPPPHPPPHHTHTLQIYVEHSNEVWNGMFPQGKHATARGKALGLSTSDTTARYRYHALRSAQLFDLFTAVFGPEQRAARLKYVVASWGYFCNGGTGCAAVAINETLSWGGVAAQADLLAVAGYFDCGLGRSAPQDMQVGAQQAQGHCAAGPGAQLHQRPSRARADPPLPPPRPRPAADAGADAGAVQLRHGPQ
jgi:hypothetical protein